MERNKIIETKDLVTNFYTYEGVVHSLNKINLTVYHGETFGLVGESGCGKSVTVRSMIRVIQSPGKIEGGEVRFYADPSHPDRYEDLLTKTEKEMQGLRGDQISMIFQEPNAALNPVMTIGEQVSESFLFHRSGDMAKKLLKDMDDGKVRTIFRPFYEICAKNPDAGILKLASRLPVLKGWDRLLKKEAMRRSIEIIGQLGISNPEELVTRYPHNMSGGMKQRIVIAIALACHPTLLIADEATSNLDVTIQAQILDLLCQLKQKHISSILLITHDLGVVAETCDRVGVMYAGSLCEVAPVNELFKNPLHPYTSALLNSVPKFDQEGELATIEGSVPNLVRPPDGCRFHPRCPKAMDICRRETPQLVDMGKDHQVACHLYTK